MSQRSALYMIVVGLLLTAGGVGGTEHATNDADLFGSLAIAIVGLLAMMAGTLGVRNSHFYD